LQSPRVLTDFGPDHVKISLRHPTARLFLRRLKSGELLLVKHGLLDERVGRTELMAFVSDDDGQTWQGGLMLDDREKVTWPDRVQAPDGTIYIIYDHQRYTLNRAGKRGVGSVVMATFREDDVRAARVITDQTRLRIVIAQLHKTKRVSQGELK
jgi:hypothetical protein